MASSFDSDPTFDQIILGDNSSNNLFGTTGNDQISGLGRQDRLFGKSGSDLLLGGTGNDWIYGQGGLDKLEGHQGNDRLFGGQDNDWLVGGGGKDWLWGQSGNDDLEGGRGHDCLLGGAGDDLLIGGLGRDSLFGGPGADIFGVASRSGLDTIFDFRSGLDQIQLEDGIAFQDLRLMGISRRNPHDTVIIWQPDGASRGQRIAFVKGITPAQLSEDDFIVPEGDNAPPIANEDQLDVDEGGTTNQTTTGSNSLLANDTDPDLPNDTLTVNLELVNGPSFGTIMLDGDGSFSYTHDGSENFSDRFVYEIQDEAGATAQANVEITINPVNDAPVLEAIADQTFTLGDELRVPIVATDPESPLESLTFSLIEPPEGMAIDPESQAIVWTPMQGDLVGEFEIAVQVSDDGDPALSDQATFMVSVLPPAALEVTAGLANDTGVSESDGITSDPTIAGTISDVLNLDLLEVAIAGPVSGSFSVTAPGTDFSLSREEIEAQLGESLIDGEYRVEVAATDIFGNSSTPAELLFVLDTSASPLSLDLDASVDSEPIGDRQTTFETVTLVGQAEPGVAITLLETGDIVTANETGAFEFPDVTLALGENSLTINTVDLAGNTSDFTQLFTRIETGFVNQPPVFEPVSSLTVMPGDRISVPLRANDPEGEPIQFFLESEEPLPTGMLAADGTLMFAPTPEQVGTFEFTVIASDGEQESRQLVTLEVVADPVTTTRVSGVIQDTTQMPLAGVVVEIGSVQVNHRGRMVRLRWSFLGSCRRMF